MAQQPKLLIRWKDFETNVTNSFKRLRDNKSLTDVTLSAEGQILKCHQLVLCASSPQFSKLLKENASSHPIIILKDVKFNDLELLMEFMYTGKVVVPQVDLNSFLSAANNLQVKGLSM